MAADHHNAPAALDSGDFPAADSPGMQLRRARAAAGLSVREVATPLRLLPTQIDALEQDDCRHFNNPLFYRAHLRAYAKLLGLDGDALVARSDGEHSQRSTNSNLFPAAANPIQRPARGHSFKYWGVALVALLSWLLWQTQSSNHPAGPTETARVVVDSNDQSSLLALDSPELPTNPVDESGHRFIDAQQALVIDLPAGMIAPAADLVSQPATSLAARPDELRFRFTEDCWVEVIDGFGAVIFASLKRADETLELSGTGPFKVLLGYAHGVSLDYNGQPVEISVNNSNNSARLVVGNMPVR